ncbi:DUF1648 domain-containing protein [Calothrix sp. UHCC 0171]|uniref:DUF1648 domain-containing protein n=1 Tax=Calothrix sp. UHCC 0171 TaxID=3110245 RepID=UPI002B219B14|nr:DUF1648 domain-containing protein [Calothrix sp. UHCC 0171]MEA5573499.1 DUF1648 domain-containing protein [Calothrix sp. UHCC 0171]
MSHQRPVLLIPQYREARMLNWIAIAGIVGLFGIAIHAWFALPETIPTHFGFYGRANGWGSKNILWLFPILSLWIYGLLTLLNRYPHIFNYPVQITEENALRQYQIACSMLNWLKTEMIWLFAYTEWQIFDLATRENPSIGIWFLPVSLIVIFGTVAYWLRQSFLAR